MINFKAENRTQMNNLDTIATNPKYFLGDVAAENEWASDAIEARAKFLHTSSYQDFLADSALILLGRTGTGKTAILKSIEDAIKNRKIDQFSDVVSINFNAIVNELVEFTDGMNLLRFGQALNTPITVIINTIIMKHIYEVNDGLNIIENYLKSQKVISLKSLGKFMSALNNVSVNGNVGKVIQSTSTLSHFITEITKTTYMDAIKEMHDFLKHKSILVLIDSMDEYDLSRPDVTIAVKSLIAVCFDYYNQRNTTKIYLKIALPSEVYTRLLKNLPSKHMGNTVVIQWKYRDLMIFIAIRMYLWCVKTQNNIFDFHHEFKLDNFYYEGNDSTKEAFDKAVEFLNRILPVDCPTSLNFDFDTLAYILRHTLKRPREIMLIFNAIMDKIIKEGNIHFFHDHPDKIREVVHATQETMIAQDLSMYLCSYENIDQACTTVLQEQFFVFQGKEIKDRLKEAVLASNGNYDAEDIKRVLWESGLVGQANQISTIKKNHPDFKNKNDIDVITASFEYQIKGQLSFITDKYYVIHPMCYEHYKCWVDKNTLIYPDRFEDEGDMIYTILMENTIG